MATVIRPLVLEIAIKSDRDCVKEYVSHLRLSLLLNFS